MSPMFLMAFLHSDWSRKINPGEVNQDGKLKRPLWIFVGVHTWIVLVKHCDPYWIPG